MKDYMEFSAKTVDEAITKALLELGISSDRLEYEVIEKGSTGILGMFTRPAVIRVAKPAKDEDEYLLETPEREEKASEKNSRGESLGKGAAKESSEKESSEKDAAGQSSEKESFGEKTEGENSEKEISGRTSVGEASHREMSGKGAAKEALAKEPVKSRPAGRDYPKNPAREHHKNTRNADRGEKNFSRKAEPTEKSVIEKPVLVKPEDPAMLELLKKVEKFLGDLFGAMQMPVQIETGFDAEEKTVLVNLTGGEMGVLIGKRGQTLDSIQYLCSLVANKGEEEYFRVKVDTENYRERRKETLETLARNISFKVKRTKRPISLEPMNPYERRVIHAALQNDKYVVTRSEGVEPYRHIVISPKNTRYGSKK